MPDFLRLPIDELVPEIVESMRARSNLVLRAPPGAGKTTRVPPAVLDAGLAGHRQVVVLEPRRIAARAAAQRIADDRSQRVGGEVGFIVRFEPCISSATRLVFVTEGVLLRMIQDDPFLERVGVLCFDEFHERRLDSDLALALARTIQLEARPELKLLVMSATLDTGPIARFLGDGPEIVSAGRQFPVAIEHLDLFDGLDTRELPRAIMTGISQIVAGAAGDILAFLPGVREIRESSFLVESLAREHRFDVVELFGDLAPERQAAALRAGSRRRVVLATNVAETSVTVENVAAVLDSGLARIPRRDANLGLDRLMVSRVSQASADQRAGRAGRLGPGTCYRLWPSASPHRRPAYEEAEIRRLDLAGPVLQLACWGIADPARFAWFEAPPAHALAAAQTQLSWLGLVDAQGVPTTRGRQVCALPVSPRLGRMVVEGQQLGHAWPTAVLAALLAEGEWRRRAATQSDGRTIDLVDMLPALTKKTLGNELGDAISRRHIERAAEQLVRLMSGETLPSNAAVRAEEAVCRSVLAGFPDRLCRRRARLDARGVMVGGRGVRLLGRHPLPHAELLVALDVEAGSEESVVRLAVPIDPSWLRDGALQTSTVVEFDDASQRVVAWRRSLWGDLAVDQAATPIPEDGEARDLLLSAARRNLADVLPRDCSAFDGLLARIRCLGQWRPDLALPAFTDDDLRELLADLSWRRTSFAELRQAPWADSLLGRLSSAQRVALEQDAPERLVVPSGARIALRYEAGRPPILAVRIQELFGLRETPRVGGGRVPVLLHLLAPNYRPQQVTDDLASFWRNTYPLVRKELRPRYPKHAWPEDPLSATPERRPKRAKK